MRPYLRGDIQDRYGNMFKVAAIKHTLQPCVCNCSKAVTSSDQAALFQAGWNICNGVVMNLIEWLSPICVPAAV